MAKHRAASGWSGTKVANTNLGPGKQPDRSNLVVPNHLARGIARKTGNSSVPYTVPFTVVK